jgi:hypothetical protein
MAPRPRSKIARLETAYRSQGIRERFLVQAFDGSDCSGANHST